MKYIHNTNKLKKVILISISVVASLAILLVIAFVVYINGFEYVVKINKCGTDQLIVGGDEPQDPTPRYRLPSDSGYYSPDALAHYFCTEQEALDAGYLPLFNKDGSYNQEYLPSKYN